MARSWREASTLIIATRSNNVKSIDFSQVTRPDSLHLKGPQKDYQNFKVLMLKRAKSMGFMANAYVFPGGIVDKADFSGKWWDVFRKRSSVNDVKLLTDKNISNIPVILQPLSYKRIDPDIEQGVKDGRYLSPEIAMRVTAIRETFEECGILIARPNKVPVDSPPVAQLVENSSEWQERVQKDATQMIKLCEELDCSPDIWALHPWSNWLTPSFMKPRFDSIFYIVSLDETPQVTYSSEVSNHLWSTPLQFLAMAGMQQLFLPPPQVYENSRLLNFVQLDELREFSKARTNKAIPWMFPIRAYAKDGAVHVLPGDDLYPKDPDYKLEEPPAEYNSTIAELKSAAAKRNRMLLSEANEWNLDVNVDVGDGHFRPVNLAGSIESKL